MLKAEIESMKHELSIVQSGKKQLQVLEEKNHPFIHCLFSSKGHQTMYESLGCTEGPRGEKGDKGSAGIRGSQGRRGFKGKKGPQGPRGDRGDQQ